MDDYDDDYENDLDEYDDDEEDLDDEEDFDDDIDDYGDDEIDEDRLRELEELGSLDGQQDGISGSWYTGYGMSVEDLDDLSDEEKDAYESGYSAGFGASGGWDNH